MICTCSWQIWWDSLVQWVNTVSSSTYSHWRTPTLRSLSLCLSLSLSLCLSLSLARCKRRRIVRALVCAVSLSSDPLLPHKESWTCWHFPARTADALTVRGFSSLRLTKEISIRHAETRASFQRTEPSRSGSGFGSGNRRISNTVQLDVASRFPWCWYDLIWSQSESSSSAQVGSGSFIVLPHECIHGTCTGRCCLEVENLKIPYLFVLSRRKTVVDTTDIVWKRLHVDLWCDFNSVWYGILPHYGMVMRVNFS